MDLPERLEPIRESVESAKEAGFLAFEPPFLDMKVQGGWVVSGMGNFEKLKGGHRASHMGWVFDNKADATNFYNEFKKAPATTEA